jgi:hypothetical protein
VCHGEVAVVVHLSLLVMIRRGRENAMQVGVGVPYVQCLAGDASSKFLMVHVRIKDGRLLEGALECGKGVGERRRGGLLE